MEAKIPKITYRSFSFPIYSLLKMAIRTTISSLFSPVLLFLSLLSASADYSNSAAAASEAAGGGIGPCFTSLFSFGDSVSDTGNQMLLGKCPHCCSLPNGETYFGRPTGRCCNGRLIVDFIAEKLGHPLLTPFPGELKSSNFRFGANLAEGGASAFEEQQRTWHRDHLVAAVSATDGVAAEADSAVGQALAVGLPVGVASPAVADMIARGTRQVSQLPSCRAVPNAPVNKDSWYVTD
ncbi:unnamed protein product [Linum trigynum]|uniref:GDSL esterase/lipase n=2 Tax=Linum trigynum TaxID=586398 RepID=A0AAV2DPC4_9ROSI